MPGVIPVGKEGLAISVSVTAMLTGMVNIAVFAAFWPRVEGVLLPNAEFKPVLRPVAT